MVPAPTISVLVPLRDQAPFVAQALHSLLAQTERSIEVIAVDDGSVDETAEIVAHIAGSDDRLRLLRRRARGIVAALNDAAGASRAPLLARLDGDDRAHPRWLERQRTLLDSSPGLVAVSCRVQPLDGVVVGDGWRRYLDWLNRLINPDEIARELFVESPLAHPTVLMRRDAFEHAGGYRDFDGPEDYDLWLRLAQAGGRFAKVAEVLVDWRDSEQRLTRSDTRYRPEAFIRLKAAHLARLPLLAASSRPIVLWGAGRYGRLLGRALQHHGIVIAAYVDIDPHKIGRTRRGCPVLSPAELALRKDDVVLGAVPIAEARDRIRAHLGALGRREEQDFLLCA